MKTRVSLVNKCLAIFGAAIVLIIAGTLSVPWQRSSALVQDYQLEVARQLADLWLNSMFESDGFEDEGVRIDLVWVDEIGNGDSFVERAKEFFLNEDTQSNEFYDGYDRDEHNFFLYARAITKAEIASIRRSGVTDFGSGILDPSLSNPTEAMLVVRRNTTFARDQLGLSRTWIIISGVIASMLAALLFFFLLKRLIFSPVRKLRRVSERVQQGDLTARSTVETGDEFEELAVAFNEMLNRMEQDQKALEKINESLDLKVEELAEVNVGLFESGRLKNEFLANVSHELRTPLNSIIGFAELLESMPIDDEEGKAKRLRYLKNILTSGHSLLGMINELLDLAKIEAGRMEVSIEATNIEDLLEGLCNIMRPQAKAASITLEVVVDGELPLVQTDPGKLQQILYNYLSNAIKFSPKESVVSIDATHIVEDSYSTVRIGVIDRGPGIPDDMIDMVFEKFRQVDATHTREHAGTGLGLAICRELAELLRADLSVASEVGKGASFYVDVPEVFTSDEPEALMPE